VGIQGGGATLGNEIIEELLKISDLKPHFLELAIDKTSPSNSDVKLSQPINNSDQAVVLLIDDVLNSGKTMFYALKPFLNMNLKKLETAFLVNRAHRSFPIAANYTGIELATTIQEHINFNYSDDSFGVYLE
jgi:pyrimidine operon attenuation protein/uracil phosphoribosyltransferase